MVMAYEWWTAAEETVPRQLVTKVVFPVPRRAAYMKFPNPASRYAIVGVMVAETTSGIRVAVTVVFAVTAERL